MDCWLCQVTSVTAFIGSPFLSQDINGIGLPAFLCFMKSKLIFERFTSGNFTADGYFLSFKEWAKEMLNLIAIFIHKYWLLRRH